ncbi:MAG: divergent polysaccharide deacetylase family protein, partial [Hyphomicrobiales bacterium]
MEADDLNAPLGQSKKKTRLPKLPVAAPQMLAGALGLIGVVVILWAAFVNDPLGGEPIVVVATKPAGGATESPGG